MAGDFTHLQKKSLAAERTDGDLRVTDAGSEANGKASDLSRNAVNKTDEKRDVAANRLERAASTVHEKVESCPAPKAGPQSRCRRWKTGGG
jgi:hypothetical protein